MSLCVFFRYPSAGGDRYRLEVNDSDVFFLVHETAKKELVEGPIVLRGESDEHRIEAGLNKIDELAANLLSLNEAVEAALEGLKECRRKLRNP